MPESRPVSPAESSMSSIGTGPPTGDPYHPHALARAAYRREQAVRQHALAAARTLERLASHRHPLSAGQALAIAMKIRRDLHRT